MWRVGSLKPCRCRFQNGGLEINADASGGQVGVEVLTADGQVQPGFSMDDCVPLTTDSIRHSVQWQSATLADAETTLAASICAEPCETLCLSSRYELLIAAFVPRCCFFLTAQHSGLIS